MNIVELVNKYGPEIIWYAQIKGIIGLSTGLMIILFSILIITFTFKITKKSYRAARYKSDKMDLIALAVAIDIINIFLITILVNLLVNALAQIFIPEYWIINQIIERR